MVSHLHARDRQRLSIGVPIHISGLVGRAYLSRGAWLWLALRTLLGVLLVLSSASPIRLSFALSASLVAAVCVLSYLDLRRRHESVLLHNLGMPVMLIVAIATVPAILAESAIKVAQALAR